MLDWLMTDHHHADAEVWSDGHFHHHVAARGVDHITTASGVEVGQSSIDALGVHHHRDAFGVEHASSYTDALGHTHHLDPWHHEVFQSWFDPLGTSHHAVRGFEFARGTSDALGHVQVTPVAPAPAMTFFDGLLRGF